MRKGYRVFLLAIVAAACVVPVGFALSLESDLSGPDWASPSVATVPAAVSSKRTAVAPRPVMVVSKQSGRSGGGSPPQPVSEGTRLVLVGGAFFGLAAVMRRAV
jgi:hypothetical protein